VIECDYCDGRKFYTYNVDVDHPYFGRAFPCPKCNKPALDALCGLRTHEREITLKTLRVTSATPCTAEIKRRAQAFIGNPRGLLPIYGTNGNGKTIALMAIVNACIEKGIEARYITGHELMDYLKEAFDPKVMDTDIARINRLARIPVLVIDELEKAKDTEYAADMQQHLINERYRDAKILGTVICWNGEMNTLPWPAVVSRLSEYKPVKNTDPDLRAAIGEMK